VILVSGFGMGKLCVSPLSVICMLLAIAAATLDIVALVFVIKLLKNHKAVEVKRVQAIGRWNQIIDSTLAWKKR